jgi:hypothetical protein
VKNKKLQILLDKQGLRKLLLEPYSYDWYLETISKRMKRALMPVYELGSVHYIGPFGFWKVDTAA